MAILGDDSGANGSEAVPPDAAVSAQSSLVARLHAEVRRWPRALLGMIVAAIVALVVAGVWTNLSGSGAGGFHAFILGPSGTAVHEGPTLSSGQVGDLPSGAGVVVVCTRTGDAVAGPRHGGGTLTSRVWDEVRPDGSQDVVGFVPDALVKTGTVNPVAHAC